MHNKLKISIIVVLSLLIILQICHQYFRAKQGESIASGVTGLPIGGIADNDTHGRVPGNPAKCLSDANLLYKQIETYRHYHQGLYPEKTSVLWQDIYNNFKQYGYRNQAEAENLYANPDAKFDDTPMLRKNPLMNPFIVEATRPDGSAVGSPKSAGTKDRLAYTTLYFHMNRRHFNGYKDTISPVGFFVVVWDDGTVQKMPYKDLMFIKQPSTGNYLWGFKGQAGVPADAIPFNEFYKNVPRGNNP